MDQKALRYEDFIVGDLIEAKIDSVTPAGISVNLGVNLQGFIPKLHWADDPRLKKPELRFVGRFATFATFDATFVFILFAGLMKEDTA